MDAPNLEFKETRKSITLLEVKGKLDIATSIQLEKKLNELFHNGEKNIILDMAEVDLLTSSGIRIFMFALKKAESNGGKFTMSSLQDHIAKVLKITGVYSVLHIFQDKQEAFKSYHI